MRLQMAHVLAGCGITGVQLATSGYSALPPSAGAGPVATSEVAFTQGCHAHVISL